MRIYVVTVKLPKNKQPHDPANKITATCPVSNGDVLCTDATGEHHTTIQRLTEYTSIDGIVAGYRARGYHVTRVEGPF